MTIVCIAGAHRSGTSMITRLLNLSGLYLGAEGDISIRAADNPEGSWENLPFVRLNEAVLAALGGAWDLPPRPGADWELATEMAPFREQARHILRQFEGRATWGWKDPCNSLTLAFWRELLPEMKVIICLRNPLDAARSLSKRGHASPEFGLRLWSVYLRHLMEVVPAENRIVTHYDLYSSRPRAELERILALLDMSATDKQIDEALASIAAPLRHSRSPWQDVLNHRPPRELIGLYRDLCLQAGAEYLDFMRSEHGDELAELLKFFSGADPLPDSLRQSELDELRFSQAATELDWKNNQIEALHRVIREKEQNLRIAASALEGLHQDPVRETLPANGPSASASIAICTIASKNYLSLVRIFAHSVATSNPGVPLFVLLVDKPEEHVDPATEPYTLVTLEELKNIPNPPHLFFKYSPIELNTAAKPYFLEYLLDEYHFQKICYFDPDIYIFSELANLWQLLEFSSLVLTPHITEPYPDDQRPNEMSINLAGVFNLGFLGLSDTSASRKFLAWWQQRLYRHCFMKPSEGMHVDQNWVNFAPAMYEAVFILRDKAFNIAYWNLHERGERLRFEHANLFIDERQAAFFHFSGFNPESIEKISVHQNRYRLSDFPNLRPLFEFYRALLQKHEYARIKQWPYAYGKFDNGVPVAQIMRGLYNQQSQEQILKFGDPFSTAGKESFFSWMNEPVDGRSSGPDHPAVTRLQMEMYDMHADLQRTFPDVLGKDRLRFSQWLQQNGARSFSVDPVFIQAGAPGKPRWPERLFSKAREAFLKRSRSIKAEIRRARSRTWSFQDMRFVKKQKVAPTPVSAPLMPPSRLAAVLPFGVNIAGYLQGEFGVGEIARAAFKSLSFEDVPCVLNNVVTAHHRHDDRTVVHFSQHNPYHFNLVHVNADQAPIFALQKGTEYFRQRCNIACWFWELSTFPLEWQSSFDNYQEIWVASGFCQQSIAARAPIPVIKMAQPVLIDREKVNPDRARLGLPQDKFIYGFIFDYMSFVERKNPLALINAFKLAFGGRQDVLLLIKTINSDRDPQQAQRLHKAAGSDGNIRFIDGYFSRDEIINLVSSLDAYVSLHRSEGLGISLAQAMYLEIPVIATGYSGNLEFMDHNNSFLVRHRLAEIQENHGPYTRGEHWADPDVEHAAELMRLVLDNPAHAQKIAARAAADIQSTMTPAMTGRAMKERLTLLME